MLQITDDFSDPADHLALDEAMLIAADDGDAGEQIRFWEFASPTVVAGRSTRLVDEIDLDYCEQNAIPVMRRCSGGASVVGGPGCLMYSVVLSLEGDEMRKIDVAHQFVMGRVLTALQHQVPDARWQGICDLTWQDRKCSGNSLKIARQHLLYHGTILYAADLDRIARVLKHAPRQPEYRAGRDHAEFVTNVPIEPMKFVRDMGEIFGANDCISSDSYDARIRTLRGQRYDDPAWHSRH